MRLPEVSAVVGAVAWWPSLSDDYTKPAKRSHWGASTPTPLPASLTAWPWEGVGGGEAGSWEGPGTDPWDNPGGQPQWGSTVPAGDRPGPQQRQVTLGLALRRPSPGQQPGGLFGGRSPGAQVIQLHTFQTTATVAGRGSQALPGARIAPRHGVPRACPPRTQGHSVVAPWILPGLLHQARSMARERDHEGRTDGLRGPTHSVGGRDR